MILFISATSILLTTFLSSSLDICVQAIENVLDDEVKQIKNMDNEDNDIAPATADSNSVVSSNISSVTDILKKMDESKYSNDTLASDTLDDVPSTISEATIIKLVDDPNAVSVEVGPDMDDSSNGVDCWTIIDNDKKKGNDEFAAAAGMIGSYLYNSGVMSCSDKGEININVQHVQET